MADPAVDLWASDEVHFQQHGSRCRMWVPPETKDPILLHHPTRELYRYAITPAYHTESADLLRENIQRYVRGETLRNLVEDKRRGY